MADMAEESRSSGAENSDAIIFVVLSAADVDQHALKLKQAEVHENQRIAAVSAAVGSVYARSSALMGSGGAVSLLANALYAGDQADLSACVMTGSCG